MADRVSATPSHAFTPHSDSHPSLGA
jgi:hypothetical protein